MPDIRFIFHAHLPISLRNYIQETGRGGRDGKRCECVLFFRAQDSERVRTLRENGAKGLPEREKARIQEDILAMTRYALSTDCRYSMLAAQASPAPGTSCCRRCDNCPSTETSRRAINRVVIEFLQLLSSRLTHKIPRQHLELLLLQTVEPYFQKKIGATLLEPFRLSFHDDDSLRDDIFNLLEASGVIAREYSRGDRVRWYERGTRLPEFLRRLQEGRVQLYLHLRDASQSNEIVADEEPAKLPELGSAVLSVDDLRDLNFLVSKDGRFYCALEKQEVLSAHPGEDRQHQRFQVLEDGLFYSARLDPDTMRLNPRPKEQADQRRIYRKFGSSRFLSVYVEIPREMEKEKKAQESLAQGFQLYGRRYRYLWAKVAKRPQEFVFFAESGAGIESITAEEVRNWCIPLAYNPDLTLGKLFKRMKLSFSETMPAGTLPDNTMILVDDIESSTGNVMSDGCGLLSRGALNHIWTCFKNLNQDSLDEDEIECEVCPYTSFQGRIGGMKGMWILDDSIGANPSDVVVHSRHSQLKYKLPMKCLQDCTIFDDADWDAVYDTVEVCSWDKGGEKGHLNARLIQILEYRGVSTDFFIACAEKGMDWLTKIADPGVFFEHVKRRHDFIMAKEESSDLDNDLLFRMASASLDPNEPAFARRRDQFVRKEIDSMRKKVRNARKKQK